MKLALAVICYAAALTWIYAAFNVPGAEGLNRHVMPQTDAEITAALLLVSGCSAKLMGHVFLFASARSR